MHKFYDFSKTKRMLALLNFIKYVAWSSFFIYQGKSIQLAIDGNSLPESLYKAVLLLCITKLAVMLTDLASKFIVDYSENCQNFTHWTQHFPNKLFQDNASKHNLIYLIYFDYLPTLYRLDCALISNQCTMISVFTAVFSLLIYTGFYIGIIALSTVLILHYTSKNLFLNQLNYCHKAIHDAKSKTVRWISEYFQSFRETGFNWQDQIKNWSVSSYKHLYQSRKRLIKLQLLRDLFAQLLVEIPFVVNTGIVILGVYYNYLTITELFIWVGLSQFMINASNAFLENRAHLEKRKILLSKIEESTCAFTTNEAKNIHISRNKPEVINVKLLDDTVNSISLEPGIYHIKGTNGSGKSTVLNSIIGYERLIEINNHQQIKRMLSSVTTANIRVIEREPTIFNDLVEFNQQILGPELSKSLHWQSLLTVKTKYLFTTQLHHELQKTFKQIEAKFYRREFKQFSSGEKILISYMRTLASWDKDISILVVDECTAFLDTKMRALFLQCLCQLSDRVSVYITTHETVDTYRPVGTTLKVVN